ncbi:MAG: DUF5615 family PIN-like protein [Opitutales bacterium]
MKIVVDMNLSPQWATVLVEAGFEAVHWSEIGAATATDVEIFEEAAGNGRIVFTNDLDFGAMLASKRSKLPSVIQMRVRDVAPAAQKDVVISILGRFSAELRKGAFISIEPKRHRVRMLPL